jgi:hypothetical protein
MLALEEKTISQRGPCGKLVTAAALNRFGPVGYDHLRYEPPAVGPPVADRCRSPKCDYRPVQPVLVVIGGLPATGKSTIGRILAAQSRTPYLRVDRIEQAIVAWSELTHPLGPSATQWPTS